MGGSPSGKGRGKGRGRGKLSASPTSPAQPSPALASPSQMVDLVDDAVKEEDLDEGQTSKLKREDFEDADASNELAYQPDLAPAVTTNQDIDLSSVQTALGYRVGQNYLDSACRGIIFRNK